MDGNSYFWLTIRVQSEKKLSWAFLLLLLEENKSLKCLFIFLLFNTSKKKEKKKGKRKKGEGGKRGSSQETNPSLMECSPEYSMCLWLWAGGSFSCDPQETLSLWTKYRGWWIKKIKGRNPLSQPGQVGRQKATVFTKGIEAGQTQS